MNLVSPAKINLFLYVTGKRTDGYHNLVSFMCPLELHDRVLLTFGGNRITMECTVPEVPVNAGNLAYCAADLFFMRLKERLGSAITGLGIFIEKNIPVAAGLGGGSSNAAAVLLGLNRYFKHPFSTDELMDMGLNLGADVPFFIFQKPSIATGVGEKLTPFNKIEPYPVVTITPNYGVSTEMIYKKLNFGLTKGIHKFNINSFIIHRFNPCAALYNDLEAVTVPMYPEVAGIKEALRKHGAMGALMSGSGPTVFGLFSDANMAKHAYDKFVKMAGWKVYLTRLLV